MKYKLLNNGLKSIFKKYDIFIIDLCGVIHNGINLHEKAIETLEEIDIEYREIALKNGINNFQRKTKIEDQNNFIKASNLNTLNSAKIKEFKMSKIKKG